MYKLPSLKYELNALEPYISERTMSFHYLKHHQTYIDNLNKLIVGTKFENMSLEDIIKQSAGNADLSAIFNNAAQAWNHTFFWESIKPNGGGKPKGKMLDDINASFGSYENFRKAFKEAAISQFGSGWAWLVRKENNTLAIVKTSNADTPIAHNLEPIAVIDVWEHAYYLDYQNKRGDFVDSFLDNLIYWKE